MSNERERCRIHDDHDVTGLCSCSYIVAALRARLAETDETICKFQWRAGLVTPPGADPPVDGARCALKRGHSGYCSFILDAVRRGWKIPDHLPPPPNERPSATTTPRQPYSCNVPMCGESGVCEECRKRGAR